jgi:hypothetical protein
MPCVVTLSVLPFVLMSSSRLCAKPHADHTHNPITSSVFILASSLMQAHPVQATGSPRPNAAVA